MTLCSNALREAGKAYPRTCRVCGLGPCHDGYRTPVNTDTCAPWLQTINPERSLRRFDLVNPTAVMVHFPTMARVLARIPRFGGHTEGEEIYSVAQHCVEGAFAILRDTGNKAAARAFLLHDGHEYITGDLATPIKQALAAHAGGRWVGTLVTEAIKSLQRTLDCVIYGAAGIAYPLTPEVRAIVREYDLRMCRTERDVRMDETPFPWVSHVENAEPVAGVDLSFMSQKLACGRFLAALGVFDINRSE